MKFLLAGAIDESNPESLGPRELEEIRRVGAVELLGFRSDVQDLMGETHVVVLPSYYGEGLPKVLIEASAAGRAIITTDMPGCREAIDPEVSGVLVAARSVSELTDAMIRLAVDRGEVERMGAAARNRAVQLFRIQDVTATHLKIYEDLGRACA